MPTTLPILDSVLMLSQHTNAQAFGALKITFFNSISYERIYNIQPDERCLPLLSATQQRERAFECRNVLYNVLNVQCSYRITVEFRLCTAHMPIMCMYVPLLYIALFSAFNLLLRLHIFRSLSSTLRHHSPPPTAVIVAVVVVVVVFFSSMLFVVRAVTVSYE